MANLKRAFIFGAGFSRPAGMPLATELLPLLQTELKRIYEDKDMQDWLDDLRERLKWLSNDRDKESFASNIEQVFHYAHFDREVFRLRQHLSSVGRQDGPGTPWNQAETISAWLSYLEEALRDVILNHDEKSDLRTRA
jgi:hypothetical protein